MEGSEKQKSNLPALIFVIAAFSVVSLLYFYNSDLKDYLERRGVQKETETEIIANENAPANSLEEFSENRIEQELEVEKCYPNSVDCSFNIVFLETNNLGKPQKVGDNKVIIFDPSSSQLDFKVNLGLNHPLYEVDINGNFLKDYTAKSFRDLVTEENALLDKQVPLAAINADYIDKQNNPQGLNISRGVEYSGDFKDKRSAFSISKEGVPSIGIFDVVDPNDSNYITVGGNGRFYKDGIFKDICVDLGEYACLESTERSMAAITAEGYVILLTNQDGGLLPEQFDDVLTGISKNYQLGSIEQGILFDGGKSPSMYYSGEFVTEGLGPIGSVLLIYKKGI